jgi:hypothetical protein
MDDRPIRRNGRVEREIPLHISGLDADGKSFVEETKTLVVSQCGAKVFLEHCPLADYPMVVQNSRSKKQAQARLASQR